MSIGLEPLDAGADRLARVVATAFRSGEDGGAAMPRPDDADLRPSGVADILWNRAPTEACVIFGAASLTALVEALPNSHVVLASRSQPPIPLAAERPPALGGQPPSRVR